MKSQINISIILVSYNSSDTIISCIDSIYHYTKKVSYEIILVDNNSSDNTVDLVRNQFPSIPIICNSLNLGYGAGMNIGVKHSKGEYVLILNNDVKITGNTLENLYSLTQKKSDLDCIGIQLKNPDGSPQKSIFNFPSLMGRILILTGLNKYINNSLIRRIKKNTKNEKSNCYSVPAICGAFMFINRQAFNLVGGFDEDYFLYHEELDLCYRLREKGYSICFYGEESIIHFGKRIEKPANHISFLNRNRSLLLFYEKHRSLSSLMLLNLINISFFGLKYLISIVINRSSERQIYIEVLKMNLISIKDIVDRV